MTGDDIEATAWCVSSVVTLAAMGMVGVLLWRSWNDTENDRRRRDWKARVALVDRLKSGPPPMVVVLFVALAFAAIPDVAMAQGFGGGGGFLQGLLQWIQSSVVQTLATLAVIGAGIILMVSHHSIVGIITICGGVWIIFNADSLVGMLH